MTQGYDTDRDDVDQLAIITQLKEVDLLVLDGENTQHVSYRVAHMSKKVMEREANRQRQTERLWICLSREENSWYYCRERFHSDEETSGGLDLSQKISVVDERRKIMFK